VKAVSQDITVAANHVPGSTYTAHSVSEDCLMLMLHLHDLDPSRYHAISETANGRAQDLTEFA
jgi:hypothetical protein